MTLPRTALLLCAVLTLLPAAGADVLHLRGGGEIVVAEWWEKDGTVFYRTDAGTIGIPGDQVVSVSKDDRRRPPSYRGAADSRAAAPDAAPRPEEASNSAGPPAQPGRAAPLPGEDELSRSIDQLETELRRAGSAELASRIEQGLADVLVLRARRRFHDGDAERAIADYERALAHVGGHRLARIELGWLLLRQGDLRRSRGIVETGLAAHPSDGHLLELQGEIFYRLDRLRDALETLRRAQAARPGDERIARRLEKLERELAAERDFRRSDSQHFTLRYDGDRDEPLGRMLLDVLEQAWRELTEELDSYPTEPVTVIVYTRREFSEATRQGPEVGGLFDGKIRLPAGGVEGVSRALVRVARHELTHALVHHRGRGRVPRWLHEGLAQLLEPRSAESVRPALALAASRGGGPSIDPFSYPTALSFTAWLDGSYSRARLLWLIDLLARGTPENDAFSEAFGAGRRELIDEWREWLPDRN